MLDTATEPAEVESPIVRQLRDSSTLSAEQVFDELVAVSSSNVQMKCVQRRRSNFGTELNVYLLSENDGILFLAIL